MDQTRVSGGTSTSDRDHSPRELIDRNQFDGLAIVLVGMTQVLLGLSSLLESSWTGLTESSWTIFVLGGGGWLLIGIGGTVFRGKTTFETRNWLSTAVTFVLAVGAAAGAVWVLVM